MIMDPYLFIIVVIFAVAICAGAFANKRGRSGIGWFLFIWCAVRSR